ncbi:Na+/H+ antiporter subunit E [Promicromonospora sp. NPDC052451]|uniref:Na+/H+ antiporter subunit E n=2 Tax=unclassified Promicromonospora TaxID=2647929 RepID=UPI0037CBD487
MTGTNMTGTNMTGTDQAAAAQAAPGTEGPRRRWARRLRRTWPTSAVGAVLWVLLWGDLSWANLLSGAVLGALVAVALPLPPVGTSATVRPGPLARLAGRFVADLVVASFQVAWRAVAPGPTPRGGLVTVPLRATSELFVATTAGLSSMVPGTVVVDLDRDRGTLRLHVLDLERSGGPDAVRQETQALEERLLLAFAPGDELARLALGGER